MAKFDTDFKPKFYALHFNGCAHAAFLTANAALAYQCGENSGYFHIVDADGNRVTMRSQPHHPGHAYAIMAKLASEPTSEGSE